MKIHRVVGGLLVFCILASLLPTAALGDGDAVQTPAPVFAETDVTMPSNGARKIDLTLVSPAAAGTEYTVYEISGDTYTVSTDTTAALSDDALKTVTVTFPRAPASVRELCLTAAAPDRLESRRSDIITVNPYAVQSDTAITRLELADLIVENFGARMDLDLPSGSPCTREQGVKLICCALLGSLPSSRASYADLLVTGSAPYTDVPANRWSAGCIAFCKALDILPPDSAARFNPSEALSRADAVAWFSAAGLIPAGRKERNLTQFVPSQFDLSAVFGSAGAFSLASGIPDTIGKLELSNQKTLNAVLKQTQDVPVVLTALGAHGEHAAAILTLTVNANSPSNVASITAPSCQITQPIPDMAGVSGSVTLISAGVFNTFQDLYLDGEKLTRGTDYTAKQGSTILIISKAALQRAGTGTHTAVMTFVDDNGGLKLAAQNFTIRSTSGSGSGGGSSSGGSGGSSSSSSGSGGGSGSSSGSSTPAADTPAPVVNPIPVYQPVVQKKPFTDVPAGAYYYSAVQWALRKNIAKGGGKKQFHPNDVCSRAEILTFLWRVCSAPEPWGGGKRFSDVPAGAYYEKAVQWAGDMKIVKGEGNRKFNPNAPVTRAEAITFIYRAKASPKVSAGTKFTDVPAGIWYEQAVSWAVKKKIAEGVSGSRFDPNAPCTRAQIVTFLYRTYK